MTKMTIKKTVGLMLTLLVLISALPMTAFAATGDLAAAGGGDTILYDLWLGDTQVTSDNMNDILGDGGKAKFDPDAKKLYLDNPTITGFHNDGGFTSKLFSAIYLCIEGSCVLSGYNTECGIYAYGNDLILSGGKIVVKDNKYYGVMTDGDLNIDCDLIVEAEVVNAVSCNGIFLSDNMQKLDATCTDGEAIYYSSHYSWHEGMAITTPEEGYFYNNSVYPLSGEEKAKHVVIENFEYGNYKLWVGSTQVTKFNKDDILGDGGKAKFDPESGTLTLDDPDIAAVAITFEGYSCKIYSEGVDLTVAGSYTCSDAADYCIAVFDAGLTLRGGELNAAAGDGHAIYADKNIDIVSGEVTAFNSSSSRAAIYTPERMYIGEDVLMLEAGNSFGMPALYAEVSFETADALIIAEPDGGYAGGYTVYDADNNVPSHVKIAFDDSEPAVIDHVDILDIAPPVAGEKPDYTASLPDGVGYQLRPDGLSRRQNGVAWMCSDQYLDPASAVFEAGKEYKASVYVVTKKSRDAFSPDLTCTLNGMAADGAVFTDDNTQAEVSYTFTCAANTTKYDLWLGSTQVTSENLNDILGDGGKAKFDPETGTLTLNDPLIRGSSDDSSGYSCVILSKGIDLTVEGSYHMEPTEIYSGLRVEDGDLTLAGDFTIYAMYFSGVYASGNVTVASGTLTAVTEEGYNGVYSDKVLYIGDDVERIDAGGLGDSAVWGEEGIVMSDKLYVSSPEGAYVDGSAIMTSDGETWASRAVIGPKPVVKRLLGDADNNGVVNVFDSSYIQKGLAGANGYPDYLTMDKADIEYLAADSDGNGVVNIFDAALVQKYLSGASTAQGYGISQPIN